MRYVLKKRLSAKISIFIFVFLTVFAMIILLYLTGMYSNLIRENTEKATERQAEVFADTIENYFNMIKQRMDSYVARPAVMRLINENYSIEGTVGEVKASLPELCAEVGGLNLYLYGNSLNRYFPAFGTEVPEEISRVLEQMKETQFINSSEFRVLSGKNGRTVYCVRVLKDAGNSLPRGLLIVKVAAAELAGYVERSQNGYGDLYVITSDGTALCAPLHPQNPCEIQKLILEDGKVQKAGDQYVCVKQVKDTDLFIAAVNGGYGENSLALHFRKIFLMIAVSLAAALVLSQIWIRGILKPLKELTMEIREADPDGLKKIEANGREEEIQVLAGAYNELVEKVNDTIDKKYKAELALKQAQINSLQYQINPHFVNNTLQLIGSMAAENNMFDLYGIVLAFSRIFYYSVKFKGGSFVLLKDELEFLDDYILLQQARYPGKLFYEKEVQEGCRERRVPKLIIQPLIENCFSHAFVSRDSGWKVKVRAEISGKVLVISVRDNGGGMKSGRRKELEEDLKDPDKTLQRGTSHIGIRNVNARLCLLYGVSYRLTFRSEEGKGTVFYIRIPVETEEKI